MSEETRGPALGYSEADGIVQLRMKREDYHALLMCIGGTQVIALREGLELANRISEGNPRWTPYRFEDEPEKESA